MNLLAVFRGIFAEAGHMFHCARTQEDSTEIHRDSEKIQQDSKTSDMMWFFMSLLDENDNEKAQESVCPKQKERKRTKSK